MGRLHKRIKVKETGEEFFVTLEKKDSLEILGNAPHKCVVREVNPNPEIQAAIERSERVKTQLGDIDKNKQTQSSVSEWNIIVDTNNENGYKTAFIDAVDRHIMNRHIKRRSIKTKQSENKKRAIENFNNWDGKI